MLPNRFRSTSPQPVTARGHLPISGDGADDGSAAAQLPGHVCLLQRPCRFLRAGYGTHVVQMTDPDGYQIAFENPTDEPDTE